MAKFRSWLYVPGDSERKLEKAPHCGADVVIVDLEDAVLPQAKDTARSNVARWLKARRAGRKPREMQAWVRINPAGSKLWRDDLAAIMPHSPDGIALAKCEGPEDVRRVAAEIAMHEHSGGIPRGRTKLLPVIGETPRSAIAIAGFAATDTGLERMIGLTWGAEDLAGAIGAQRKHDGDGAWTDLLRTVRAHVLLAARAAGRIAIDTPDPDFQDLASLGQRARDACADGWSGMMAIHPAQVPVINEAFTPDNAALAHAQAIIAAFAENPDAGAVQLGGKMIERPHLVAAKALVAKAQGPSD